MATSRKACSPSPHTAGQGHIVDRVLQIPAVNSTLQVLQAGYVLVKDMHPLIASMCTVYEKGVLGAGSLAWWSMQPIIQRLTPQIMAANELACKSLDNLQEMVPALQYPPEKITSELTESISAAVSKAGSFINCPPVISTSDHVIGVVASGLGRTRNVVNNATDYARKSEACQLVVGGVNAAKGKSEDLVKSCIRQSEMPPVFEPPSLYSEPQPGTLTRIGKLAHTIFQRSYALTIKAVLQAQCRGQQELAFWFPGLVPLAQVNVNWTEKNVAVLQQGMLGQCIPLPAELANLIEELPPDPAFPVLATAGSVRVLGSLAQDLQRTCLSTVYKLKNTPSVLVHSAGEIVQLAPKKTLSLALEAMESMGGPAIRAVDSMAKMVYQLPSFARFFAIKEEVKTNNGKNIEDQGLRQKGQDSRPPSFTPSGRHDASVEGRGLHFGCATTPPLVSAADTKVPQERVLEHTPYQCLSVPPGPPVLQLEESTIRTSAFVPYKDASRRRSDGFCSPKVESTYTRSFYSSLHVTTLKKD